MRTQIALFSAVLPISLIVACSTSAVNRSQTEGTNTDPTNQKKEPEIIIGGQTASDGGTSTPVGPGGDPTNCADAALAKSYLGCDFWPTITYNPALDDSFDFAAVVSNQNTVDAVVTTTGPNGYTNSITVKPGETGKVYMPWIGALKDMPNTTVTNGLFGPMKSYGAGSLFMKAVAYHLVSNVPVVAYQFNPLEYKAGGGSGPAGKDWSKCVDAAGGGDCYSYSNDASLLLPSTALTGNYRIYGPASSGKGLGGQSFMAITATQAGTSVSIKLSATANVIAGPGVSARNAGSTMTLAMNAGDVAILQTPNQADDLSGSLLKANNPVQVITGMPCTNMPYGEPACDHIEESIFPVETLGKHYYVVPPTGPNADVPGMLVRVHGNVDGTKLTYLPAKPAGCPATINAGENISCGDFNSTSSVLKTPFEVTGDHEFAVSTFQLAGALTDPTATGLNLPEGDPSQSQAVSVEQFRASYTFLTPNDYAKSYVDVVSPTGAILMLDGAAVSVAAKALSSGYELRRITLNNSRNGGAHKLTGDKAFGIQVSGYGSNTSYQYPGGLNLGVIADVPVK